MKVRSLKRFSLPLTLPLLALACSNEATLMSSPDDMVETAVDENGIGIINGRAPSEAVKASTVALLTRNSLCSGTILSDRYVLTASHCVTNTLEFREVVFGESYLNKPGSAVQSIKRPVVRIINENINGNIAKADFAIVEFKGGLPAGFVPAKLPQANELLGRGSAVTIAGYGRSSRSSYESGVLLQGSGTYDGLSEGLAGAPTDPKVFMRILNTDGTQHCHGDSGGPTYILKNGQLVVMGVTSHGRGDCADGSYVTDVRQQLEWIKSRVGDIAPQTPDPTPTPQPPAPPSTGPELSPIGNVSIQEDATFSLPIQFKGEGMTCEKSLAAVPQGNTLISASRLRFRTDATRGCILEGNPLANANGNTTVSVQLKRANGEVVAQRSFILSIAPVNDAPVIAAAASVPVWGGSVYFISAQITDVDNTLSCANDLKAVSLDSFLVFHPKNFTEQLRVAGRAPNCQVEFYAMSATSKKATKAKVKLILKDAVGSQAIRNIDVMIRPR